MFFPKSNLKRKSFHIDLIKCTETNLVDINRWPDGAKSYKASGEFGNLNVSYPYL
jgi:hypothetical protein